jgi:FKBP-type peptidyl-prolyl cis-trans isomerase
MVFWGRVVDEKKTLVVIPDGGSVHLLQVCLEAPEASDKGLTSLYVQSNKQEKAFLICHLGLQQPQFSLCHELVYEDSPLTFWTTGGGKIHITGTEQEEEEEDDEGDFDDNSEAVYDDNSEPEDLVELEEISTSKLSKTSEKRARSSSDDHTHSEEIKAVKKVKTVAATVAPSGAQVAADIVVPQTHQQRKKWKIKPQNDEGVLVLEPKLLKKASGVALTDYILGTGAEPKLGAKVKITYEGSYPDGTVFDQNIKRGKPFTFRKGTAQVIRGLDLGMEGMKIGGSREIVIPPELG